MPLFKRKPKEVGRPSAPLPPDETIERATRATLLQGRETMKGRLWLTNYRLLFEAEKGRARWMVVPFDEIRKAGLHPWSRGGLGTPSSRQQCLVVETTVGEQVWWDFGEREEREWLPLVQERIRPAGEDVAGSS